MNDRIIKFRAWDTYNKKMIPEKDGFYLGSSYCEMMGGDDYPIMQYTGLKDNTKWEQLTKAEQEQWLASGKTKIEWNGKEIYEGDILFYDLKKGWEIFFEDGCYYMMHDGHSFLFEKMRAIDSEIIGNIYENPELLKEK